MKKMVLLYNNINIPLQYIAIFGHKMTILKRQVVKFVSYFNLKIDSRYSLEPPH